MRWLVCAIDSMPPDLSWLAQGEVERADRMRFARRRTSYLGRRWTAKQAVAATLGLTTAVSELGRIEIANHASGAPYVLVDGAPAGVEVSMSDRAGLALCVVDGSAVGCDLELVEPRSAGFVQDFFTGAEQAYVEAQRDLRARAVAANLVWSAKESALKLLGYGLRRDTRSVEVSLASPSLVDWSRLKVRTIEGQPLAGWWRREGDYLFTVASYSAPTPPQPLDQTTLAGSTARPRSRASTR